MPPPATVAKLALALGVPSAYFERRVDRRRPDPAARSFFRSLRATPQRDRDRADALAEHVFDLVDYLDRKVTLPELHVPSLTPRAGTREEIEEIAAETRRAWNVPEGPIANVVRLLEAHGIIVARLPSGGTNLDAFSRWFGERPLVLLWADKGDKARSRFDGAHELGHLVMHADPDPLDREQERQANMFASAFLMPAASVASYLPTRAPNAREWQRILDSRRHWGVSAKALLYRARELGVLNESAFRRTMIDYNRRGMAEADGSELGSPEAPLMLHRAAEALGIGENPVELLVAEALVPRDLLLDVVAAPSVQGFG